MLTIEFRVEPEELGVGVRDVLAVYVDGVRLQELVRPVERPFADREGKPDLAGRYAGLADRAVRWPSPHFLGEPILSWFGDGDTVLLGCICGEAGCWPLTARVDVADRTVTWHSFRKGHRDWDLSALGTLTFDREQYERALRESES